MAEEDPAQKTEEPTPRKLAKARQKGQVGMSQEVKNWTVLLGGTLTLAIMSPWLMSGVKNYATGFIEHSYMIPVDPENLQNILADTLIEIGLLLAPFFVVLMLLAVFASVVQTGLMWSPERIAPNWNKISILKGIKRMFAIRSIVEFLKGIMKLGIVTVLMVAMAVPLMQDLELMPGFHISEMIDRIFLVILSISAGALMVMTVIAVLDFLFQKFDYMKSMRMSRQEIKDEHKETEGDPQIKARIRKLRAERAQQRMMAAVPEADVVITNPTHYSIALEYKMESMAAPRLVAKGVDHLAFKIREVAKEHDIAIVENAPLARALYSAVEIDEDIPVEHYKAVAEVIGYVMRLKGDIPSVEPEQPIN